MRRTKKKREKWGSFQNPSSKSFRCLSSSTLTCSKLVHSLCAVTYRDFDACNYILGGLSLLPPSLASPFECQCAVEGETCQLIINLSIRPLCLPFFKHFSLITPISLSLHPSSVTFINPITSLRNLHPRPVDSSSHTLSPASATHPVSHRCTHITRLFSRPSTPDYLHDELLQKR